MKKIVSTCVLLIICTGIFAQYKKAGFFGKEGRTYGLGAQLYNMGDGKGSVIGYNLSFGRDQAGKQLFNFWELRFIPSFDFSYETRDYNNQPVTVKGASKMQLIYALNYGYFILPNEDERPFKPYVTAGINIQFLGGVKSLEQDYYDVTKQPSDRNLNIGIGGGVGTMINLGANFSLKIEGGYTYQWNDGDKESTFFFYTSHTYASAGIRYRLVME